VIREYLGLDPNYQSFEERIKVSSSSLCTTMSIVLKTTIIVPIIKHAPTSRKFQKTGVRRKRILNELYQISKDETSLSLGVAMLLKSVDVIAFLSVVFLSRKKDLQSLILCRDCDLKHKWSFCMPNYLTGAF